MKLPPKWLSIGGLVATILVVGQPWLPLGVRGEWEWPRHAMPLTVGDAIDRLLGPLLALAVLWLTCRMGQHIVESGPSRRYHWLAIPLFLCSVFCTFQLRSAAPAPHRDVKGHWVLYDRFASGYFAEAAFHITSAEQLLSGYEARMRKGDVLHEGTHPPGLYLANWYALQLTAASPRLTELLVTLRNQQTQEQFRLLESAAGMGPGLSETQFAALTLMSILTHLLMCLGPLVVFEFCLMLFDPHIAWRAACLTIIIPALQVFFPKSDVIFATSATLFLWLALASPLARTAFSKVIFAVLAAIVLFCGMLVSLAHLPAVMVYLLSMSLLALRDDRRQRKSVVGSAVVMLTAFMTAGITFNATTSCNLFRVWQLNLTNHAGFYDQYQRTVWKWLMVNPLELAIAAGVPVFCFAAIGSRCAVSRLWRQWKSRNWNPAVGDCVILAMAITIITLWLTGRNSGEAARLWCFLTPWLVIIAASVLNGRRGESPLDASREWSVKDCNTLLLCQFACAVIVVARVNGFLQL